MSSSTISFSYGAGESPETVIHQFEALLSRFGLERVSSELRSAQIVTESDIENAGKMLHVAPNASNLPYDRIATLTRVTDFTVFLYTREDGNLSASISMSSGNDFPALGIQVWTDAVLHLPAGFITIRSSEDGLAGVISAELLRSRRENNEVTPDHRPEKKK